MSKPTQTADQSRTSSEELSAEALHVGDTVVWTSKLNKEYRYEIKDVDSTWITFRTGLMIHVDRFERGVFEVIRSGTESLESGVSVGSQQADPNTELTGTNQE